MVRHGGSESSSGFKGRKTLEWSFSVVESGISGISSSIASSSAGFGLLRSFSLSWNGEASFSLMRFGISSQDSVTGR